MHVMLCLQELIFTARRVCGSEALQLGLVDHCLDEGKALPRALELAREIAQVWHVGVDQQCLCVQVCSAFVHIP